jgi:hypothetical protein
VLAVLLLAAAICGCSSGGPLGEYQAARTLHLAPDGRLIVTDLGSGKHDGTVEAVDMASGRQTELMRDLPSTSNSGRATPTLPGPAGPPWPPTGPFAQPSATRARQTPDFATLRCTNGLVVDLEAFQARSKPPSNPYDVVSDGRDGWYVSDGAANNVLHVDQAGKVKVVARFSSLAASGLGQRNGQGVPTGMTLGLDRTLYVALYGGAPFEGPPAAVISLAADAATRPGQAKPKLVALMPHPIALALAPGGLAVVDYGGAPGERGKGELRLIDTEAGLGSSPATAPEGLSVHGMVSEAADASAGIQSTVVEPAGGIRWRPSVDRLTAWSRCQSLRLRVGGGGEIG